MGKKKQAAIKALREEMEIFVRDVFSGQYSGHSEVKNKPVLDNPYLLSEIKKRCLGFDMKTYSIEFSIAYRNNR